VLAAIALSVVLPVGIVGVGIELFSNAEMNKDREKVRFCHAHCRQLKEDPHVTRDVRGMPTAHAKSSSKISRWSGREPWHYPIVKRFALLPC
jgi:hypothetical protein